MAYLYETLPLERIRYAPGAVIDREIPRGNLFAGINLLLSGKATVAAANATNAPDFQVLNLVRELEIIRDTTTVIRVTGQRLAALLSARNGIVAADNSPMSGVVGVGNAFQHFLPLVFAADDLAIAEDMMMDTRAHKYTLRVTWNNASAQGVLFGTNNANVSVVNPDDIILEFELERLGIVNVNPQGDKYAAAAPKMRGIFEVPYVVTQTGQIAIDIPVDKTVRSVSLLAVRKVNNVEVGSNAILTGDILLENTNNKTFHRRAAKFVRQKTSQALGLGSSLATGFYKLELTKFGNIVDSLKDVTSSRLKLKLDVTKLAEECTVYALFDTVENQGVAS